MIYYVYIYLNPLTNGNFTYNKLKFDYEPFYIGIGKNDRINDHLKNIHYKKKLKDVDKVILNIVNKNKDPIRLKLYENITIESAKRLEKYFNKINR